MTYKIKFEVYDNTGELKTSNLLSYELTNPTVGQVKSLVNPWTYTNIKSELFSFDNRGHQDDSELITTPFIKYRIDLN
jgi:hypothetical protein